MGVKQFLSKMFFGDDEPSVEQQYITEINASIYRLQKENDKMRDSIIQLQEDYKDIQSQFNKVIGFNEKLTNSLQSFAINAVNTQTQHNFAVEPAKTLDKTVPAQARNLKEIMKKKKENKPSKESNEGMNSTDFFTY